MLPCFWLCKVTLRETGINLSSFLFQTFLHSGLVSEGKIETHPKKENFSIVAFYQIKYWQASTRFVLIKSASFYHFSTFHFSAFLHEPSEEVGWSLLWTFSKFFLPLEFHLTQAFTLCLILGGIITITAFGNSAFSQHLNRFEHTLFVKRYRNM